MPVVVSSPATLLLLLLLLLLRAPPALPCGTPVAAECGGGSGGGGAPSRGTMSGLAAGKAVKAVRAVGHGPMTTLNPFLFCVYHKDAYPAGNARLEVPGVVGDGSHFDPKARFRMYHGTDGGPGPAGGPRGSVPGFPQHPHRGFETITAYVIQHTSRGQPCTLTPTSFARTRRAANPAR
jgi:hypothetical protein